MDEDDAKKNQATNTNKTDAASQQEETSSDMAVTASGGKKEVQTTNIPIPSEAEDSDLIEKEWVERAKEIVEHTKHDPHEQQKALSLMKADYMKKRYNRDIKVSEEDLKSNSGK